MHVHNIRTLPDRVTDKYAISAVSMLDKFIPCSNELKHVVYFILTSIDRECLTLRLHSCVIGCYEPSCFCYGLRLRKWYNPGLVVRPGPRMCVYVHVIVAMSYNWSAWDALAIASQLRACSLELPFDPLALPPVLWDVGQSLVCQATNIDSLRAKQPRHCVEYIYMRCVCMHELILSCKQNVCAVWWNHHVH